MTNALVPAPSLPDFLQRELPFARTGVRTSVGLVHTIDDGPKEAPAVLLVHGNPMWCFLWRKVIRELRALPDGRGLRVIAPDLLGLGLSDKPAHARDHQLELHVTAIAEVLEALAPRSVIFAGQDWGGPIGAGAVSRWQARGGNVRAMLLANTSVLPLSASMRETPFHRFARTPVVSDLAFRIGLFPIPVMHRVQGDPHTLGRREKRAYAWPLRRFADRAAPLGLARMVPTSKTHPSVAAIDAIGNWVLGFRGPIGLVWGKRDPILGRSLGRHQKALSTAFVEETEAGHFLQEEVPELLARSIVRLHALAG
ncbi:MAG: alpha/beta fold hydrolase [Sandaracinus sp.]